MSQSTQQSLETRRMKFPTVLQAVSICWYFLQTFISPLGKQDFHYESDM